MKPYPKYKDSGVEWIGEVPEGWEVKRLKYVATINPSKENSKIIKDSDELVTFLPMEKVNEDGTFATDFKRPINELWNGFTYFEELDTIFAKITPCFENGKGAYLNNLGSRVGFGSTEFHVLREIANTSISKYIYYITRFDLFRRTGESLMIGVAGQKRVSSTFIENFLIGIPPVLEQQSITTYLDHKTTQIDKLILKKQKLIELLKEERAAIINQAVTKGLNPDAPMKDSGIDWLGEIPKNWEVKRLKFLVNKVGSGVTPRGGASVYQNDGIPLLRSQNIHFDGLKLDDVAYISEEIHNEMSGSKVKPNDVLLNITGASIGRCCVVPADFGEANVNQHVCIIRPNRQIKSRFLHNYISSNNGQAQIFSSEKGISREGLNFEQLKGFQVLLPPIDDQKDIKNYIESATTKIDQTTSNIEKQIDLLQEYRTALISEVVTGKLDVRDEGSK